MVTEKELDDVLETLTQLQERVKSWKKSVAQAPKAVQPPDAFLGGVWTGVTRPSAEAIMGKKACEKCGGKGTYHVEHPLRPGVSMQERNCEDCSPVLATESKCGHRYLGNDRFCVLDWNHKGVCDPERSGLDSAIRYIVALPPSRQGEAIRQLLAANRKSLLEEVAVRVENIQQENNVLFANVVRGWISDKG